MIICPQCNKEKTKGDMFSDDICKECFEAAMDEQIHIEAIKHIQGCKRCQKELGLSPNKGQNINYCADCGKELSDPKAMLCQDCERFAHCSKCGDRVKDDTDGLCQKCS